MNSHQKVPKVPYRLNDFYGTHIDDYTEYYLHLGVSLFFCKLTFPNFLKNMAISKWVDSL